jgi:hypothetical protein
MRLLTVLFCGSVLSRLASGQGWQPEQVVFNAPPGQPDQKPACGRMPGYPSPTVCVYQGGPAGSLRLFEVLSWDGGVSWSSPVQITNEPGDQFDPFIAADAPRGKLWMVYSQNASPGNNLMIRGKPCAYCSWSGSTTVIGDGQNHWDASLVVLGNGHLLALEQWEGFGGSGAGRIRSVRSTDGGISWGAPVIILDETGEESFPRAVQKSDGVVHLMFRDRSHGTKLQIGQLWSSDYGYSWSGHSVFSYSFTQDKWLSFIGSQGGANLTVIANTGGYVYHWLSWDNGNTWGGPYQVSSTTGGEDGEMSVGCRGPIFTLADGNRNFRVKRYDWYPACY